MNSYKKLGIVVLFAVMLVLVIAVPANAEKIFTRCRVPVFVWDKEGEWGIAYF